MRIAIYNQHFRTLGGGERRSLALAAHLAQRHEVTIIAEAAVPAETLQRIFAIDPAGVRWLDAPGWGRSGEPEERFDVFINNSHLSDLRNPARFGVYMCMFPEGERPNLSSYQVVTANSAFTAAWIARKWGVDARVVYSACQDMGPPARKQNIILNVGRFFAADGNAHHKHQGVLLQSFLDMRRAGLEGWELHLIGNCGQAEQDRAFLADLRRRAEGQPVRIETGVEFDALRQRYRDAALYWHATGFEVVEDETPSACEHFGMAIVEAMSAGATPFAVRAGGPREIIQDGVDGFLWSTPDELQQMSWRLIRPDWRARIGLAPNLNRMSRRAVARSRRFTLRAFLAHMDEIVGMAA